MKKLYVVIACMLMLSLIVISGNIPASASSVDDPIDDPIVAEDIDLVSYFAQYSSDEHFGGIYYDDGTLIVNYVGNSNELAVPYMTTNVEADIEYHSVQYSLKELEEAKNYLGSMMNEYGIVVLDANEMTNQIDISLAKFTNETIANIKSLVNEQFGHNDFLNFIDMSACTVKTTIAYESSHTESSTSSVCDESSNSLGSGFFYSGALIEINGSYLTLGPALSKTQGYSAGHTMLGSSSPSMFPQFDVYLAIRIPTGPTRSDKIGTATCHFGGSNKDWALITNTAALTSLTPVVSTKTPSMGVPVHMIGAMSGHTTGKVTGTNQLVSVNNTTLTGMCSASYSCKPGDSGAGIYDNENIFANNVCTYGIQSSASFYSNGEWAGTSFFTPFPLP